MSNYSYRYSYKINDTGYIMKIGSIVPTSMLFPAAGLQLTEGLSLAKKLFGTDKDEIVIDGAGTCTDAKEVQKVANRLLLNERVDVIVAYVGHKVFDTLIEICNDFKKILILADMGGVVAYSVPSSPYVFTHSFNEWTATYNLGRRYADSKHLLALMSLMEAGYSLGYTFSKGLEAEGNSIKGFIMSKLDIDQAYFDQVTTAIKEEKPDVFYCGFTGKDADTLLDGIGAELEQRNTVMIGSGWLTLPKTLEQHGQHLLGAKTASAYYTTIDNEANKTFLKQFEEETENDADSFAVLGYEIGMMIYKAATYNDSGKLLSKKTAEALEGISIDSPRGKVSYHPVEHYAISGCWFAEVKEENGKYYNEVIDHIEVVDMEVWRADEKNWPNGGWLNPYPCT